MTTTELIAAPRAVDAKGWAALPVLLAGTFMVVLDFFIVNVALPAMQADLGASSTALEWVVAGYGLTLAALLVPAGRLGDRHGRRSAFGAGLALFTLTSAACGLAWSPGVLVAARFAQGAAAALMSPQVLSIMGVVYRDADRVRAMSVYGIVLGVAAAGGQLVGGALIQSGLGWRACFLINVPVGLAALAALRRCVPESRSEDGMRIDALGVVLVTLGLVDVVLPLVEGPAHGWPAWTWVCLAAAPLTLGAYAARQLRTAHPLTPPALFRDPDVRAGLITQLLFWGQQAAFFLVFALYVQPGRGLDALQAGLVFTIVAAAYLAASARAPALTERHGARLTVAGGVVLAAGHLALAVVAGAVGVAGSLLELVPGLVLVGTGMGLCITPLTATVMQIAVRRPDLAGSASGVLSAVQQVGNAVGVAVTGVVFFGALDAGYGRAFSLGEYQLAAVSAAVAVTAAVLRRRG
jgi:EmrB/QacA subfamily drug resistance transporter